MYATLFILSNCHFRSYLFKSYLFISMHFRSCLSNRSMILKESKKSFQLPSLIVPTSHLQSFTLWPGLDGPQGRYWPLIQPQEIRVVSEWGWAQLLTRDNNRSCLPNNHRNDSNSEFHSRWVEGCIHICPPSVHSSNYWFQAQ